MVTHPSTNRARRTVEQLRPMPSHHLSMLHKTSVFYQYLHQAELG